MSKEYIIPECSGVKIDVKQGQSITVIDIEGGQVVDFFAEVSGNAIVERIIKLLTEQKSGKTLDWRWMRPE